MVYLLSCKLVSSLSFQAQRLGDSFRELLDEHGEKELPMKEMVEKLMVDTFKDDESMLPHIYPPEREYHLSSIFVETHTTPIVSPVISLPI